MRRRGAWLLAACLPMGAGASPADRLGARLEELRHSESARYGCFEKEPSILGSEAVDKVVLRYQRSRDLPSPASARALLSNLIEYTLRPSEAAFAALRRALMEGGAPRPAAEDVCRCLYYGEGREKSALMASVAPPAVGLFWAARVLHEAHRTEEALGYYGRALEADPSNPRTRLLYAIALIAEDRAADALRVLGDVPPAWAPEPVAYWRARALVETGEPAEARRLLEAFKGRWADAPTAPEAWIGAGPVQPADPPACLLGRALAEEGDEEGARALLGKERECGRERGRLDLRQGRPFDALLELSDAHDDDPLLLRALGELGACDWALAEVGRWDALCREDHRPEGCAAFAKVRPDVVGACPTATRRGDGGDDAGLMARLTTPRLVPFEERRIPSGERWAGKRPDESAAAKAYPALSPFTIVTVSEGGPRLFAISVSQDVDPRGEVSAGGYWLHLSADRGATWRGPYYLGFAEQFPYVVLPVSHVPPFDGDRIKVEVERREVDESTITFPPVGLRAKSLEKDLYLSIDLAAVERDSDGDGLTDLLEEKLVLDPRSPDTDRDGILDGLDPLPLQPRSAEESSESAGLLAAVLPYLFGGPAPIQQSAAAEGEESAMSAQRSPFASGRTLFVAGADSVLPHDARVRAVVLSPAVLERYRRKFGATYPMTLPDIAFDRDRRRAFVRYDFGWRGGSLLAERRDGRWTVAPRGSWIS